MTTIVFSMFNYRGKYGKCEEYNEYNEEFKHGEFQFGLFGSMILVVHLPDVNVTKQMVVSTSCNVFYHTVNMVSILKYNNCYRK